MWRQICSKKSILLAHLISFSLLGCNFSSLDSEYEKGKAAARAQKFEEAVKYFNKVIIREPESKVAMAAAREAAQISYFDTKKFTDAIKYYQHLVKFSQAERERRESQIRIASIYFDKLTDYQRAIEEYNKLLLLRNSNNEIVEFRFALSKAHFYLNHFQDAQSELERALKIVEESERKFDLLLFLGNIYFNTKQVDLAIKTYEKIMADYPERAKKDNVAMNIIVCYEEIEDFDSAISRLEKMRPTYNDPEFIDLKIKRLRERKGNLPGSRGLRK